MQENKHTPEPWPPFTDIATIITPDPEGTPVAILSWDDYIRARACVNYCAGIPDDALLMAKEEGPILTVRRRVKSEKQRDELLAALKKCVEAFEFTRQYVGYEALPAIEGWSWFDAACEASAAIASVEGSAA